MADAIMVRQLVNALEVGQFIDICVKSGYRHVLVPETRNERILTLCAITDDSKVLGGSVCIVDRDKRIAELDVLVQEQPRGEGIKSLLLEDLIKRLRELGIKTLRLLPKEGTEPYYERRGFSYGADGYMFQKL